MTKIIRLHFAVLLILSLLPGVVRADAIVVSQAMFASTIAEYFVEDDQVRVELEIGMQDLQAFRNILPDTIYAKLGNPPAPLEDRLGLFFEQDFAIYDGTAALEGTILSMGPATRTRRDAVTGEPMTGDEEEPEVVILASLAFPFETQPESLTLTAPATTGMASIGFVLYHKGVAVNDFRFLSSGYTVSLDWEDPWYSSFTQRQLRRNYFSPMAGFIYVEPFEVRKEIIVRPADIQRRYDLGLEGAETITPEMQADVKQGIVKYLEQHFNLTIDGQPVEASIDRVNFLARTLRSSVVVDGQDIPLLPATVGVIYVVPTQGFPQIVEMEWDLFTERMQLVPASSVDQAGPLPVFLEPDFSVLRWENFLKHPEMPTLTEVGNPPDAAQRISQWAQWVFGLVALLALVLLTRTFLSRRKFQAGYAVVFLVAAVLAGWSMKTWNEVKMDDDRMGELAGGLLNNVYRAFDYRGEEQIYDVLSRSVSGELLADVYLETRNGLELANQGGAQVKVKNVEMLEARKIGKSDDGIQVEARWNVAGSVGHWGHIHQRINGYHARMTLKDIDGAWKLTGMDILEEERL